MDGIKGCLLIIFYAYPSLCLYGDNIFCDTFLNLDLQ